MRLISLILFIIIIFILISYYRVNYIDVTFVKSELDNREYLVRDLPDKIKAANMLAKIRQNIFTLVDHLNKNKSNLKEYVKYIDQLSSRIQDTVINENGEDNEYTSYSVSKGEQLVFCIRSKKEKDKIHQLNLIMYVTLHELAHIACPEYGHGDLFKKIFAFLATEATKINIYNRIPFDSKPEEYCGITITESII